MTAAPLHVQHDREWQRIRAFVGEVLSYAVSVERIERAAGLSTSTWLLGVVEAHGDLAAHGIRLWRGSGCKGTKGVGRAPDTLEVPKSVDPVSHARWLALRGAELRTAEAVVADGRGDQIVDAEFGRRTVSLTLEQRVGFACSSRKQLLRWSMHVSQGDSPPALAGSAELGTRLLRMATEAWFR